MKAGLGVSGPGLPAGWIGLAPDLFVSAVAKALRLMVVLDGDADEADAEPLSPSVESNADEAAEDPDEVVFGAAVFVVAADFAVAIATPAAMLADPPRGGRAPPPLPSWLAGFQGAEIPEGCAAGSEPLPNNPMTFVPASLAGDPVKPELAIMGTSGSPPPEPWPPGASGKIRMAGRSPAEVSALRVLPGNSPRRREEGSRSGHDPSLMRACRQWPRVPARPRRWA